MMKAVKRLHQGMKTSTGRGARGEISVARFAAGYFFRFLGVLLLLTMMQISEKLMSSVRKDS